MKATDLSDQYDDRMVITRAKGVQTPGVDGSKYKDPIRGRQPDSFFSVGGKTQDISSKVDRWSRNNGRSGR